MTLWKQMTTCYAGHLFQGNVLPMHILKHDHRMAQSVQWTIFNIPVFMHSQEIGILLGTSTYRITLNQNHG